ncbi:MAG: NAD(P)-binding domain-containing protein [Crocinitomicaceae bacterium]
MNICIIGLGWLGAPLAKHLQQEGHLVVGSTRTIAKQKVLQNEGIKTVLFDLETSKNLPNELNSNIDLVIFTVPPIRKYLQTYYGDKLNGIAAQFSSNTAFIFTSSISVYSKKTGRYDETSTDLNVSSTIIQAETALTKLLDSRLTIVRLGGLIGLFRHPIKSLQGKQNIKNPNGIINFVHLNDAISAFDAIIKKDRFGHIYNVVNPDHPERESYYQELVKANDLLPIQFEKSGEIIRREIGASKICRELSFKFTSSIRNFNS